ncbi:unnamed protein product [Vitrella brassicaformis CCMP3155]|uniref:Uncharacterized protein n=1 Tax=Vitrella brassicaformis (strain CCMP3155) TaxID=1169540 RepID=A0A0G4EA28_VITBC|nr:unnamed protein product [Vitrella brassicaformis CCMP3155]|eukprot:CEL92085.1 unnamed protein product [Vitrella brassicaformis CCMP3155]
MMHLALTWPPKGLKVSKAQTDQKERGESASVGQLTGKGEEGGENQFSRRDTPDFRSPAFSGPPLGVRPAAATEAQTVPILGWLLASVVCAVTDGSVLSWSARIALMCKPKGVDIGVNILKAREEKRERRRKAEIKRNKGLVREPTPLAAVGTLRRPQRVQTANPEGRENLRCDRQRYLLRHTRWYRLLDWAGSWLADALLQQRAAAGRQGPRAVYSYESPSS